MFSVRSIVTFACAALLAVSARAAEGPMDFLFRTGGMVPSADAAGPVPRAWKIGEYSGLRRVPREGGAPANRQPVNVPAERLRTLLVGIEVDLGGTYKPLFAPDEAGDIAAALSRALAATPADDDLLLFATARREQGAIGASLSVTARVFVADGALQMVVREARGDAVGMFRAARVAPTLQFGSREVDTGVKLRAAGASNRRGNWIVVPLAAAEAAAAPAPAPAPAPAAAVAPVPVPSPAAAPAPTAPPRAAAQRPRDAAFLEEAERRLETLKRLRDRGLISEEEYQAKRREILEQL